MPETIAYRLPTYFALCFFLVAAFKICLVLYTIWAIVPEKYYVLINLVYLPMKYWNVTVPFLLFSFAFFYFAYITTDSDDRVLSLASSHSAVGQLVNSEGLPLSNQNNDCICVDKNLCYKEYYDDVYIECVSKSLQHLSL